MDAQSDLGLRSPHMQEDSFSHSTAHMVFTWFDFLTGANEGEFSFQVTDGTNSDELRTFKIEVCNEPWLC